jgi:hypothetical protein
MESHSILISRAFKLTFGQPIPDILIPDLDSRRANHADVPAEMDKILARYGAGQSSR